MKMTRYRRGLCCAAFVSALCLLAGFARAATTFYESFDDGAANNWTARTTGWTISSGTDKIYQHSDTAATTYQYSVYNTPTTSETGYMVSGKVKAWGGGSGNVVGLLYHATGTTDQNCFAVLINRVGSSATKGSVWIVQKTGESVDLVSLPVDYDLVADNWINVVIYRIGIRTTVYLNGVVKHALDQPALTGAGGGKVGVIDKFAAGQFNDIRLGAAPKFIPGITEPFGWGPTYAPTHYVDASAANDSGDGSFNNPWKWAPGMPLAPAGRVALAGQRIALKRGGVWRLTAPWTINGTGGTSTNPLVFTAYGDPNLPLPRVTVLEDVKGVAPNPWTEHIGTPAPVAPAKIFKRTVSGDVVRLYRAGVALGEATGGMNTPNWVGQTCEITCTAEPTPNPPKDSEFNPNPDNIDIRDASPGPATTHDTGILKSWKQVGSTLYVLSPAGSNPLTWADSLEALKLNITACAEANNKSHVYLDRIAFHGGADQVVDIEVTHTGQTHTNFRVTNCEIKYARKKGLRINSSSQTFPGFHSGIIKWNRIDSGESAASNVMPRNSWYGQNTLPHSESEMGSNDGLSLFNGVRNWTIAQNDVSNFWHVNLYVFRKGVIEVNPPNNAEPSIVETAGNIVEHNNSHSENITDSQALGIGADSGFEGATYRHNGATVRYNYFYNTWAGSSLKARNVNFYGNLITGVYGSSREPDHSRSWKGDGVFVYGGDDPATSTVIEGGMVAYNTFVNCAGAAVRMVSGSDGVVPQGFIVANNIMTHSGFRRYATAPPHTHRLTVFKDDNPAATNIDVDNNLMFGTSLTQLYEYGTGGDFTTVAGMQSMETQAGWVENIASNPGFVAAWSTYYSVYAKEDYQLLPTSAARGEAKNITSLPASAGWTDIGCWQVPP